MRLLVISNGGHGLGLAHHISSEGHTVNLACSISGLGVGIVDVLPTGSAQTISEIISSNLSDLTIVIDSHAGQGTDSARKLGYKVVGPTAWSTALDSDPDYMANVIKLIGWDMHKVTEGVNMHIICWYNGVRYLTIYAALKYNRLMSSAAGPDIQFAGMVGDFHQPVPRVITDILNPLEKVLRKVGHKGLFHVELMVKGEDFSVKRISASINDPMALMLYENTPKRISQIMLDVLDETSKPYHPIERWVAGALLSFPPFPYIDGGNDLILNNIQPINLKHIWLINAYRTNGSWHCTPATGKIGHVVTRGITLKEAARRLYRTISNIKTPDMQYRDDIGRRVYTHLDSLYTAGWIKEEVRHTERSIV